jgi:hypothetical protein
MLLISTAGDRPQAVFSYQCVALVAIGPAMLQHFVDPQFQQRRQAVPLHRMLQNHHVGPLQRLLLRVDIDVEIWIQLVQRTDLHAGNVFYRL